jgi:hypothetical protein
LLFRISKGFTFSLLAATVQAFLTFYKDRTKEKGLFSHIDFATKSPHAASLGINQSKKNWNSVGDHIPVYLINLNLALEGGADEEMKRTCVEMLEETSRLILDKFVKKALEVRQIERAICWYFHGELLSKCEMSVSIGGFSFCEHKDLNTGIRIGAFLFGSNKY